MGNVIKRAGWKRSDIVVSTKVFWGGKGVNDKGLSRKHIIEGTKESLKRLQLDYVDLIYAHRPDPETPIEETVRAFSYLVNNGLAFYWGTSEWSAREIAEAYQIAQRKDLVPPTMEQPQYNMFEREKMEKEYLTLFRDYGLGTTIWSPLASGVLTGKYSSGVVPAGSRFSLEEMANLKKRMFDSVEGQKRVKLADDLKPIAAELGVPLSNLSIAWCLKNPNVSSVILGASKKEQLVENLGALKVVDQLTPEVMERIEKVLGNKPVAPQNWRKW